MAKNQPHTSDGPTAGSDVTHSLPPEARPPPAPPVVKRIGHYHIKRVIGSGGMGTVYEAVQEHPRRTVAVKVMSPRVASRSALRRFEHESQILARLRHPNIAQVFEAGTHGEGEAAVPYFVMEYIPNARSITAYAEEKKLRTRQRLEMFAKVCDAIHHGHQRGIIHRDVKPGNILVDSNGAPKIIDFGVARAIDSDLTVTTLQTGVGQLIGTLQYMSPEQIEADPHAIDARADVYSLGVVLYELLSGKLPYTVSNLAVLEAARIIKEQPPTRLSTLDTMLRGDLETIVLTALHKDRAQRYQTADELGRDVMRYLNDEPIAAHRPTISYLLRSHARATVQRHPAGTMALVFLTALLMTDLVGNRHIARWTNDPIKYLAAAMPRFKGSMDTFEAVRVIRITDGTAAVANELAEKEGLEGVDTANWFSMRRLHGRLMECLAQAGVRSVTWNLAFNRESEFDEDFVTGVKALNQAGVDVVIAVKDWPLRDPPVISRNFVGHVRWGGTTLTCEAGEPWNVHLFAHRGAGDPLHSLCLSSVAAFLHPGYELKITVDKRKGQLDLGYFVFPDQDRRRKQWLDETDEVKLSTIQPFTYGPPAGREPGDDIGLLLIEVPADEVLEASSVDYEWVFGARNEELRDQLGGKAILIGDYRAGRAPVGRHPDGRTLSATYGFAAGLDMLLSGGVIRIDRPSVNWPVWVVAALSGILIAAVGTGRPWRRFGLLLAGVVLVFFVSVFSFNVLHYFLNPLVPLLAMVVACELAVGANRARRQRPA